MSAFFVSLFMLFSSSFYSLTVTTAEGESIALSRFEGKPILVVNIATGSPKANQLAELQSLNTQYGDSLVILAFPSNTFGGETRSSKEIAIYCKNSYGATFYIAALGDVKGVSQQAVYQWLTKKAQNGRMSSMVLGDFQKYLVDSRGEVVGVFAPEVRPLSEELQIAIKRQY